MNDLVRITCAKCGVFVDLHGPEDVVTLLTIVDDYGWCYARPHYFCDLCSVGGIPAL